MYIVSYRKKGPWRAGIALGPLLADVTALAPSSIPGKVSTVRDLLERGQPAVEEILRGAQNALAGGGEDLVPLEEVELGPPVPDPDKIICLGLNYSEHAREVNIGTAGVPSLFAKFRNALCGPYGDIILPRVSAEVDYEGELTVVIGRRCKDVSVEEAMTCVTGYTVMNDVSARDLQFQTSQWTAGKTLDTFAPTGPGIVPASAIPDPQDLEIITRVNGATLQHGNTRDMIFPVARTIAFLSSLMTLEPGDLIATGTPAGVGFKRQPPVFLKNGDVVEVEIDRIGTIRNTVVALDR
ncbi:MAG: fumarylacetoacetate hydrolase family protein [Candidatus Sulfobium sp.]|jgi:acylpyruvate hydrolase